METKSFFQFEVIINVLQTSDSDLKDGSHAEMPDDYQE